MNGEILKVSNGCPSGFPTDHKVASLPQFNGTEETFPCMYAGTLPSNSNSSHNLFYWMYPADDFENKPIAIWLNGGPGASSIFGNFLEIGPMRLERVNDTDSGYNLYLAPEGSWVEEATMIFID